MVVELDVAANDTYSFFNNLITIPLVPQSTSTIKLKVAATSP